MSKAALLYDYNEDLRIEEIEVDPPGAAEVRLCLSATGLCHSDAAFIKGLFPCRFPPMPGTRDLES